MEKAVILLSGGIDSSTATFEAKREGFEVHALSIDYGQKALYEVECSERIAKEAGVVSHHRVNLNPLKDIFKTPLIDLDIDEAENDRDGDSYYVVPLRNIVFLSVASAYAESIGAKHVFIGNHLDDAKGFPDCRPAAIQAMQHVVDVASEEGKAVELHSPYIHHGKDAIIERGLALGVPYEHTYSCYEKDMTAHCGKCEACQYRYNAFLKIGTTDPAPYDVIPKKVSAT